MTISVGGSVRTASSAGVAVSIAAWAKALAGKAKSSSRATAAEPRMAVLRDGARVRD
jgi:hypothetical protein